MALLRLELLGDVQMRSSSGSLVTVSAKKSQALLAYLGVKPSQRVSREKIASLLWSSTGPDQARQSLRQTLSTLRKEIAQLSPDERILIEENDLLGVDEANVSCDVAAFESLVAAGTEESLAKASTLYRGDFLDGFQINEERFDQWVTAERDRLHRMALRGHMQLLEMQSRRGADVGGRLAQERAHRRRQRAQSRAEHGAPQGRRLQRPRRERRRRSVDAHRKVAGRSHAARCRSALHRRSQPAAGGAR